MMQPLVMGNPYVMGSPYVMGNPYVMGAPHLLPHHGHHHIPVHTPAWRQPGHAPIAPGVSAPGEGRQVLPLEPNIQNGVFTGINDRITFTARTQAPFKGERPLFTIAKTSGAAAVVLCNLFTVGRRPQQLYLKPFSVEPYGPQGLDLNWVMEQAEPGVDISFELFLRGTLASPDTITVDVQILGREVH